MEDRQNLVASDVQTTHDKLTETRNQRIELEARLKRLKASLGRGPEKIDPAIMAEHAALNELATALRSKQQEHDALAVKYGERHPTMKTLAQEIEVLQAQLAAEKRDIIASAEFDVLQANTVEQGLRAAASDAHAAGLNLNLREIEYRRLNHDRDNKTKLYEIVLQRLTEADLTRMLKTTHVRVLDHALLPWRPVSPNFFKNRRIGISSWALARSRGGLHSQPARSDDSFVRIRREPRDRSARGDPTFGVSGTASQRGLPVRSQAGHRRAGRQVSSSSSMSRCRRRRRRSG